MRGISWPSDPLAAEQDLGGARRQVFFDLGVVVGQDAFDVGVGLGPVVLRVAGRDQVQQRDVLVAARLQRHLGGADGQLRFAGGEVVGGHDVRDVDDHPGVLVVERVSRGQPAVAVRPAGAGRTGRR